MDSNAAKASIVTVLAAGLGVGALAIVNTSKDLDRHGKIVIGAGNDQYERMAKQYQATLAKYGVDVQVRRNTRVTSKDGTSRLQPLEGRLTLRDLNDASSGITAAFVKGNLLASLQGRLASEKQKGRHEEYAKLRSLGRLFYEPIWVFTRGDLPIETLRDLKGKRILIGSRESGSRAVARQLLRANGVVENKNSTTFVDEDLPGDAAPLLTGKVDAAFLIIAADDQKVLDLLQVQNIRLMDFAREADAYANRFTALSKVVLRTGAVDLEAPTPSADITLLATSVALVVRPDMQPALVNLLTHAVINNPKPAFDKLGDPVLFHRPGDFPSASDPEYDVPNEARIVYKTGELPFVLRQLAPVNHRLGIPFQYTSFISAHAAKLILLIPLIAVALPMMRAFPAFYTWLVRRRISYWYRQLKALEKSLDSGEGNYDAAALHAEFDRIEANVKELRMPLFYSSQLYDLRLHIDLVRQRLAARPVRHRLAAE